MSVQMRQCLVTIKYYDKINMYKPFKVIFCDKGDKLSNKCCNCIFIESQK